MQRSELLEQLLEFFYSLNHRNPGAGVMALVSAAALVGQLLETLLFADGLSVDQLAVLWSQAAVRRGDKPGIGNDILEPGRRAETQV